jgi:hypothetical protein
MSVLLDVVCHQVKFLSDICLILPVLSAFQKKYSIWNCGMSNLNKYSLIFVAWILGQRALVNGNWIDNKRLVNRCHNPFLRNISMICSTSLESYGMFGCWNWTNVGRPTIIN